MLIRIGKELGNIIEEEAQERGLGASGGVPSEQRRKSLNNLLHSNKKRREHRNE